MYVEPYVVVGWGGGKCRVLVGVGWAARAAAEGVGAVTRRRCVWIVIRRPRRRGGGGGGLTPVEHERTRAAA